VLAAPRGGIGAAGWAGTLVQAGQEIPATPELGRATEGRRVAAILGMGGMTRRGGRHGRDVGLAAADADEPGGTGLEGQQLLAS
jgi:hypothetical protein